MGQQEILAFLRNKREMGDNSFFSIHEIVKGVTGGSLHYHNTRRAVFALLRHGFIESQNVGDVFDWFRTFRISKKYFDKG